MNEPSKLETGRATAWRFALGAGGVPVAYWLVPLGLVVAGAVAALLLSGSPWANPDRSTWTTLTPAAHEALSRLRDPAELRWYVVPLFVIVLYIYSIEIERRHWNHVFAGLALLGMDWFNELWNGLVLHFTQTAALWMAPGRSAFVLLAGWNVEIAFMFAVSGLVFANLLPQDPKARIARLPNRWFWAIGMSLFAVFVEVLLNKADLLIWHFGFWNWPNVGLIILFGYFHFFVVTFVVYDMTGMAKKAAVVASLYAFDLAATLVFVVALGWA